MLSFDAAIKLNGLGDRIDAQYGRWGHFTQEAADVIIKAVNAERVYLTTMLKLRGQEPNLNELLAATAITVMNESCFNLLQPPNTNKTTENWWRWDFGWMQLNLGWTMRMIMQRELDPAGLNFTETFGQPPYFAGDPFSGNPVAHTQLGIRRLLALRKPPTNNAGLSFNDTLEMQVVCYTGEDNRDHRQRDWRQYKVPFIEFFRAYAGA